MLLDVTLFYFKKQTRFVASWGVEADKFRQWDNYKNFF